MDDRKKEIMEEVRRRKIRAMVTSILAIGCFCLGIIVVNIRNEMNENSYKKIELTKEAAYGEEFKIPDHVNEAIVENLEDAYPRVTPGDLKINYSYNTSEDKIHAGVMTIKNNSNFIITKVSCRLENVITDSETDFTYYHYFEGIAPGSTSNEIKSYGSNDAEYKSLMYSFFDPNTGLKCDVRYDYKSRIIQWSAWYK